MLFRSVFFCRLPQLSPCFTELYQPWTRRKRLPTPWITCPIRTMMAPAKIECSLLSNCEGELMPRCKLFFSAFIAVLLATSLACAAEPNDPFAGFDDFAKLALADFKTPGLAVAVIKDGKIAFARGYRPASASGFDPGSALKRCIHARISNSSSRQMTASLH